MEGVASFLEKRKPNWHQEGEDESDPDSAGGQSR